MGLESGVELYRRLFVKLNDQLIQLCLLQLAVMEGHAKWIVRHRNPLEVEG